MTKYPATISRINTENEIHLNHDIEQVLANITAILIQNTNIEEAIPAVLSEIARISGSLYASCHLIDKEKFGVTKIILWNNNDNPEQSSHPRNSGIKNTVAYWMNEQQSTQEIVITDTKTIEKYQQLEQDGLKNQTPSFMILIPVVFNYQVLGIIRLDSTTNPKEMLYRNKKILEIVSRILACTLEKYSIEAMMENQVIQRAREVDVLFEIASLASKQALISELLKRSLEVIINSPRINGLGFIHYRETTTEEFKLIHYQRFPKKMDDEINCLINHLIENNRFYLAKGPIIIPDLRVEAPIQLDVCLDRYYSYIGLPIRVKGKLLGVLSLLIDNFFEITTDLIKLLTALGNQIGGAVEGSLLRENAKEMAVAEERQRLARELHDSVTQNLYSTTLLIKGWIRDLGIGKQADTLLWLNLLNEIISSTLKEMRLLLYTINPPAMMLDDGLEGAIKKYLENINSRFKINTTLLSDLNISLSSDIQHEIFRIVQESLNNVIKHSKATELKVNLTQTRDNIEVEIIDNGIGMDITKTGGINGMGISSMRERAANLGFQLIIESKPGFGTKIIVKINPNQIYNC